MGDNSWLPLEFEEAVKDFVLKTLAASRGGFNGPHTLAAVYWMKWLLGKYSWMAPIGKVLILSIYLHDIGWARIPEEGIANQSGIRDKKAEHMRLGAEMVREYLIRYLGTFVSPAEIEEIVFYVGNHDYVETIPYACNQGLTLVAMADTLGQIDVERVTPTLKPAELETFLERLNLRRRPLFASYPKAERQFDLLLGGFHAYFTA